MRPVQLSLALCIAIAALSLATGVALNAQLPSDWLRVSITGGFAILIGLLWLVLSLTSQWAHAPKIGWLYIIAAALGVLTLLPAGLLLVCVVASLLAWDLGEFSRRLAAAGRVEQADLLVRQHLSLLLPVGLAGLALGAASLLVHVPLSFGVAAVVAGLAVAVLALAARHTSAT